MGNDISSDFDKYKDPKKPGITLQSLHAVMKKQLDKRADEIIKKIESETGGKKDGKVTKDDFDKFLAKEGMKQWFKDMVDIDEGPKPPAAKAKK